ncbi:MAG: 5'/3'-nucleotidase SurE [Pseudomonadota bacterium]
MRILVTNDDGINALGLSVLEEIALTLSDDVWVVAPETDQSGVAHSMSLNDPLRLRELDDRHFAVRGTPTDCVLMAIQHVLPERPELVLSGINRGQNLAEDVTYSGTVAAAIEGTLLGVRSIALSQAYSFDTGRKPPFETARTHAPALLEKLLALDLPDGTLLNVNFPPRLPDQVEGVRVTRQGRRNIDFLKIDERKDGRGNPYFWLTFTGQAPKPEVGTDLETVRAGFVSVTPLSIDMTAHSLLADVDQALNV